MNLTHDQWQLAVDIGSVIINVGALVFLGWLFRYGSGHHDDDDDRQH